MSTQHCSTPCGALLSDIARIVVVRFVAKRMKRCPSVPFRPVPSRSVPSRTHAGQRQHTKKGEGCMVSFEGRI